MRLKTLKINLTKVLLFSVCALVLVSFCVPFFTYAQTETTDELTVSDDGGDDMVKETITNVFSVSPVVANEKAKARDIIKKELVVTNNTDRRIDLYITVENIDPTQGAQEFTSPAVSDLSTSLANWVEITRGVIELSAGESRKIPYLIHVNLTAKPGNYYARIQFQKGAKRQEAEASKEGTALMLNVEVVDDAKERLQLGNFISEDSIIFGESVSFSYLLENVGNRLIEPRGSIRIFNRKGEEVGSVPLNADGTEIDPDNKKQLAAVWSASGRFGKYKAFLDLEYGENQLASVQDTIYFWVFPWKEMIVSLSGVFILAFFGTYVVHMRAMANPVHATRRRSQGVLEPVLSTQPAKERRPFPVQSQKITTAIARAVPGRMPASAPAHVTVLNAVSNNERTTIRGKRVSAERQGSTVDLTPRGLRGNMITHGNVVQLSSRR